MISALATLPAAAALGAAPQEPVGSVPFELYDGRVFLSVRVNGGESGDFQFDSAAGRSCVTRRFGERIRLERPGAVRLEMSQGGRRRTVVLELRPRV
jgi:hypothetical protein